MRAVVWRGPENVQVETVPDPEVLEPHTALVRVAAASICGSDLHLYHATVPVLPGTILGHEAVGTVVSVGSQVERVRPGDRVLVPAVVGCGDCPSCRHGYPVGCESLPVRVLGVSPLLAGVQAEYVAVPYADYNLWTLPPEVEDHDALMLADIFPTGFFAAENAGVQPGQVVVVLGCGPVGLCAIQCVQLFSPAGVVAVDPVAERLEVAASFGATVLSVADDVAGHVRRLTRGQGADAVIEAVGSEETLRLAFDLVRTGGRVSMVGVLVREDVPFPLATAFLKDVTLRIGLVNVPRYLPQLFALLRRGKLNPKRLLTHTFPLSEAPAAYKTFDRKADGCLKVCLEP